jgi:cytochrome c peroxidase
MIRPLHLTDAEVAALVAFLESLTGDNIAALIADARSVRVGNVTVELPQ